MAAATLAVESAAVPLPTDSVTTFLSLNALQCDQLAQLMMGSIAYRQESADDIEVVTEAINICEQTLNILRHAIQIQIPTTSKHLCKPNTEMKLPIKPNRIPDLPCDVLFSVCDYLDSFSKTRLRFTSMTTYIDMMGCPLDLIDIDSSWSLLDFAKSYAPLRIIKHHSKNVCGCDASRQLQLIDFGTAEVNRTLCSDLTESQLSLLGIGRSWSITGVNVGSKDTTDDFTQMCNILKKHNAFRSLKRLEFQLSNENRDIIYACGMVAGYVENLVIGGSNPDISVSLSLLLPYFKMLRRIRIQDMSLDISLNDFVKCSPQIEELIFSDTNITGDISCLAQLRNIKVITTSNDDRVRTFYGDITSLSSCTKLTHLHLEYENITGNISSLITLTNLEKLDLEHTKVEGSIESLLKYLPRLNSLELNDNSNLTGNLVLTSNVELETLWIYNNHMHLDLSSLTHLKKLNSCNIFAMSHVKGDISVMAGLTKLETLYIDDCPHITGSINSLATLPNLKSLYLISLSDITGDASLFPGNIVLISEDCNNIEGLNKLHTLL